MKASRNLLRVANNQTMFEKDIVKILTTVVIECTESGFNKSAAEWAHKLVEDDTKRALIPEAYRKKVENIAIKAYKNETEPAQFESPCPFCNTNIPDYNLECYNCHNVLPFCIASGRYIVNNP
jgi:WD repeat-containing protein 19